MKTLQSHLEALGTATIEDLLNWIQREVQSLGFERMLLALLPSSNAALDSAFIFSTYPSEWRRRYDEQNLALIDPTVGHSLRREAPLVWSAPDFAGHRQRAMYEEAWSYGLKAGVTLPLHDARGAAGMLTCVAPDDTPSSGRLIEHQLPALALLRDLACDTLVRLNAGPARPEAQPEEPPRLSERERECLKWHAAGKTSWEIGRILNVTEACVNFHFSNIRVKFNVSRRHEAVLKAVSMGVISLN
jgi:LuxR family quorum-sensing transcriptional regulator LasR